MKTRKSPHALCSALLLLALLAGCTASPEGRLDDARKIAAGAGFTEREIAAGPFTLTAFERVTARGQPADVYIEGDGLAWLSRRSPSPDPTPRDALALKLAARDAAANVVYIARPCQFRGWTPDCAQKYWTEARFAPEVISATNAAIDDAKARAGFTKINLVGFSGGGGVAALAAAARGDVESLRAVSGNLDTDAFTRIHDVSPMTGSLNPVAVAPKLARLPQHYFVGGRDKTVPGEIARGFVKAEGKTACARVTVVPAATHQEGWTEIWPELLKEPLDCAAPQGTP